MMTAFTLESTLESGRDIQCVQGAADRNVLRPIPKCVQTIQASCLTPIMLKERHSFGVMGVNFVTLAWLCGRQASLCAGASLLSLGGQNVCVDPRPKSWAQCSQSKPNSQLAG